MAFPSLTPSSRSYASGDYPVKTFRSQSGSESRILYGSRRTGTTLELQYDNITDGNAQTFLSHYELVRGTFDTFSLPNESVLKGWTGSLSLFGLPSKNLRDTTATYVGPDGLIKTAAPYETRFIYNDKGDATEVLAEEESTNLWRNSTDLTIGTIPNYTWSYELTNEVTPPGDTRATKYTFRSNPNVYDGLFVRNNRFLPSDTYTASVYIYVPKQAGVSGWTLFTDYVDQADQGTFYDVFDKWVRASTTTAAPVSTFTDLTMVIAGVFQGCVFYAWGAQLESGSKVTSYIPTTGEDVRRAADNITSTGAWRYEGPPQITNVRPGISSVQVRLIGVL